MGRSSIVKVHLFKKVGDTYKPRGSIEFSPQSYTQNLKQRILSYDKFKIYFFNKDIYVDLNIKFVSSTESLKLFYPKELHDWQGSERSEVQKIQFYEKNIVGNARLLFEISVGELIDLTPEKLERMVNFLKNYEWKLLRIIRFDLGYGSFKVLVDTLCKYGNCPNLTFACEKNVNEYCLLHCRCESAHMCKIKNLYEKMRTVKMDQMLPILKKGEKFLELFRELERLDFETVNYFLKIIFLRDLQFFIKSEQKEEKVPFPVVLNKFVSSIDSLELLSCILFSHELSGEISETNRKLFEGVCKEIISYGVIVLTYKNDPKRRLALVTSGHFALPYFVKVERQFRRDPFLVWADGTNFRLYHHNLYINESLANELRKDYFTWWPSWLPPDPIQPRSKRAATYVNKVFQGFGTYIKGFKRKFVNYADYGCGLGVISREMSKKLHEFLPEANIKVLLMDISRDCLKNAKKLIENAKTPNIVVSEVRVGDVFEQPPFSKTTLSLVSQILDLYTKTKVAKQHEIGPRPRSSDVLNDTIDGYMKWSSRLRDYSRKLQEILQNLKDIMEEKQINLEEIRYKIPQINGPPKFPQPVVDSARKCLSSYYQLLEYLSEGVTEPYSETTIFSYESNMAEFAKEWLKKVIHESKLTVIIDRVLHAKELQEISPEVRVVEPSDLRVGWVYINLLMRGW